MKDEVYEKSKVYDARCCGCDLWIRDSGLGFLGDADGEFHTLRQIHEAAKQHRRFCDNYTGRFHITAYSYVDVVAGVEVNE
jgi:hypothetical protein